jgi:hypothetical protein
MKRSTSALAKFTRSVSKLGGRHRRGKSEMPPIPAGAALNAAGSAPLPRAESAGLQPDFMQTLPGRLGRMSPVKRASQPQPQRVAPGQAFIRAVPGMLALEADVAKTRAALRGAEELADSLRGAGAGTVLVPDERGTGGAAALGADDGGWPDSQEAERWQRHLDVFDAAAAEHRVDDALSQLRKLERMVGKASRAVASTSAAAMGEQRRAAGAAAAQELAWRLQAEAEARREVLADALERRISQPSISEGACRQAVRRLSEAAGSRRALNILLSSATGRLRRHEDALPRPAGTSPAGAERATADCAAAIGQTLLREVDAACSCANALLSADASPSLSAALADWALREASAAGQAVRRLALLPCAAPAGLHATVRCTAMLLASCDALEEARRVPAAAAALREMWPVVEQVMHRRVRQLAEGVKKAAQLEATAAATAGPGALPAVNAPWEQLAAVFPSAQRFVGEAGWLADALLPLASPRAVAALRKGLGDVYLVRGLVVMPSPGEDWW